MYAAVEVCRTHVVYCFVCVCVRSLNWVCVYGKPVKFFEMWDEVGAAR